MAKTQSHSLVATAAIGGNAPAMDKVGAIVLTEIPDVAMASLAARNGKAGDLSKKFKKTFGFELPGINGVAKENELAAFWMGPELWMVEAPYASHELIAEAVKKAVGDSGSVTEQSSGWVRLDLAGEGVTSVLERLCNVDTHELGDLQVRRTVIEHVGTFVICREKGKAYSLYCNRTFAVSLHHAVVEIMHSVS